MKNTIKIAAIVLLTGLAVPAAAKSAVLNGGFENGLTGWEAVGDYRVETSSFGSGTVEGMSQAFLSTAFDEVISVDENGQETRGGNAVPVSFISNFDSLEGFLGLSTFLGDKSLDELATATVVEGSAIKNTVSAEPGKMTLSFDWNFLTNESVGNNANPNYNDFAFVTLRSNSDDSEFNLIERLADTTGTFAVNGSNTQFFEETGFKTFSYTLPTPGEYTLGIGIVDVGEPTVVSGLVVDNVQAVPEADSMLGILAAVCLGAWRASGFYRRDRQQ